ncbi:ATP-binding protein [Streptomyces uncialis]|uniref:ATP-binding protein n=1 Tax=Streptomyces uncialis TaxID=1048205 RepID=UPI0038240A4C
MTNALRHGGGACTLHLAVEDPSLRMPRMLTPGLVDGTGGFGWHLVTDLARRVVVTPGPEGGRPSAPSSPGSTLGRTAAVVSPGRPCRNRPVYEHVQRPYEVSEVVSAQKEGVISCVW